MKNGLVLEGGGLRGLFTAGILDAMLDYDITFDGLIGVSAGALFGCNFKSKQKGRALRYNVLLKDDKEYMGIKPLLKTGNIVNPQYAYHVVPYTVDKFDGEAFKANPMEFWMVCTDVENAAPVYHKMNEFTHAELEWMRASASMPLVSKPVMLDDKPLLDGGMIDSIPLKAFQDMGYEKNVVILTQPKEYYKSPSKINFLFRLFCRKYPKIAQIMDNRHNMYNDELHFIQEQEKLGNTLLIYPDAPLNIGRTELNEEKMRKVHEIGYKKGLECINQIKNFLDS